MERQTLGSVISAYYNKLQSPDASNNETRAPMPLAHSTSSNITQSTPLSADLTIVLPVFNAQPFLEQTLQSALSQTYPYFQFLILDDGSTDESPQILKRYEASDKRITVFTHSNNQGTPTALNTLLTKVTTPYLCFLNADDLWEPTKLETQMAFLKANPHLGFVSNHTSIINANNVLLDVLKPPSKPELLHFISLFFNSIHIMSLLVKTDCAKAIGGFGDNPHHKAEDYLFTLKLIHTTQGHNIERVLSHYRCHTHNTTTRCWFHQLADAVTLTQTLFQQQFQLSTHRSLGYFIRDKKYQERPHVLRYKRTHVQRVAETGHHLAHVYRYYQQRIPITSQTELDYFWHMILLNWLWGLSWWQQGLLLLQCRHAVPWSFYHNLLFRLKHQMALAIGYVKSPPALALDPQIGSAINTSGVAS